MKRLDKDCQVEIHRDFKGGVGNTVIKKYLNADEFYGKGRIFAEISLEPNSSLGAHKHQGDFEVYAILQGKGEYIDNEETYEVSVGDVLICKEGEVHGIKNIGDETLKFTAMVLFTD